MGKEMVIRFRKYRKVGVRYRNWLKWRAVDVPADRLGASLTIKPSAVTRDQVAERCDDEREDVEARTETMARTIARRRVRGESGSESESEGRERNEWSKINIRTIVGRNQETEEQ
ncbi:hypothetical protein B0H14DRAFT_3126160 [Mycena olivaceomarginata]|nr:hypothetical protein B0H14DRAFT_3126160 [Mycena olivaceomarginata]